MTPGKETDEALLRHIKEGIERIQEYTGGDHATFVSSHLVQDAVMRNLQTLAESTQRLSHPIKASEPTIPWRDIAGFRNVLTHGYLGLDTQLVWSVIEQDLPGLHASVERMLLRVTTP
ncbi:MAG: DUF86 domain-containing protein [Lamprobacter sp.]|uniref:HepT-like ribonuclease domain-containing protein n=1 Tax=Lamprobacter sp. TaxID=3100796 RepID=UPI002B25E217|nr:DUF86 domain-containing protein [Lamprobacter sp.]MEA3642888.1 DUF86 domain-containing protein [Lamprobacter sp.]